MFTEIKIPGALVAEPWPVGPEVLLKLLSDTDALLPEPRQCARVRDGLNPQYFRRERRISPKGELNGDLAKLIRWFVLGIGRLIVVLPHQVKRLIKQFSRHGFYGGE
jgi:hypothetical protein